ncbi:hypothetical protein K1719_031018 [Acacia pycnantha]|nr:hypothetical protein K1719_031018 [Acacia pycnantha]
MVREAPSFKLVLYKSAIKALNFSLEITKILNQKHQRAQIFELSVLEHKSYVVMQSAEQKTIETQRKREDERETILVRIGGEASGSGRAEDDGGLRSTTNSLEEQWLTEDSRRLTEGGEGLETTGRAEDDGGEEEQWLSAEMKTTK